MKKVHFIYTLIFVTAISLKAQKNSDLFKYNNQIKYQAGNGLHFSFNDNNYLFKISGFFQPYTSRYKQDKEKVFNKMTIERARIDFNGKAKEEKLSFFISMDYTYDFALMEAYMGYHPGVFNIYFGQKHNSINNQEMNIDEKSLTFMNRSILSESFTRTAREFGVFIEPEFNLGGKPVHLKAAITSGDGRNAFGNESRDRIYGGFKYSARLELFPFGEFKDNGELVVADIYKEDSPKLVIGGSASKNIGASGPTGEGHKEFILLDMDGENKNASYDQLYFDLLFKWNGISFLAEFANSRAISEEALYTETQNPITSENISSYYVLGSALNFQLGYFFINGLSIDLRFSFIEPEFKLANSILQEEICYTAGLAWYSKSRAIKVQFDGSYLQRKDVVLDQAVTGTNFTLMTQFNF